METLSNVFDKIKAAIRLAGPRIVQTQAQTALALRTLAVQTDGLPGQAYSTNDIPTFLFSGKELNQRGTKYIDDNKMGTWGAFRAAQGLPSDRVTLTYSGRMFRSLTTAAGASQGDVFTARLVAADQEAADKVKWNTKRYGDFLTPTAAERREIQQVGQAEIARIIKQQVG